MDLQNSRTARELARLGASFANINNRNRHVTHSQVRSKSQMPDKTEGNLLLPLQIRDSSDSERTIHYANASPNLHSQILDSSQYITLSDAEQHSTRMRCYFHYQYNHFMDYFNNPASDGVVIYAGDVPFWYDEQKGTCTELLGNPTGWMFLAASRDHKFLLNHRSTTSHVSHTTVESRKTNCDYINNSCSNSTSYMPVPSLDPNGS